MTEEHGEIAGLTPGEIGGCFVNKMANIANPSHKNVLKLNPTK